MLRRVSLCVGRAILVALPAFGGALPAAAQNQGLVVRDGSLGAAPAGVVAPGIDDLGQPAHYLIRADLGEQRGSNLFHSFSSFSIGQGEVATFTGPDPLNGPQSVRHLVSRVTADNPSEIDGTLRSTIPGADFYLLNPAGVMFGPEAALDVPGSLHFGTSADLEFTTGERFEARVDGTIPLLAVAEPSAFGFLGDQAGPIRLEGSFLEHRGALSMAAGSISLEFAAVSTEPGSDGSGDIALVARDEITLAGALIQTSTLGTENAGSVRMTAPRVRLGDGAFVDSNTFGSGTGGEVRLEVGELHLTGGSVVSAGTLGSGAGGDIVIVAAEGVTLSGADAAGSVSRLVAGATATSEGDAGSITVTTPVLRLEDGALILSETFGAGDAGDIVIAAGELLLTGGSRVGADTGGLGAGGDIVIVAAEGVTLSGAALLASAISKGDAGSITVTTPVLRLEYGAFIENNTFDAGDAGDIVIDASEEVLLSGVDAQGFGSAITAVTVGEGNAGSVRVTAPRVHLGDGAGVVNVTSGLGTGGEVRLEVGELLLTGRSSVANVSGESGAGGDIVIVAAQGITLSGAALLARAISKGDAGSITVTTPVLRLEDGAFIENNTFDAGDAGDIVIEASEDVVLSGVDVEGQRSLITSSTRGDGNAGSVRVAAPRVRLVGGAAVTSNTRGSGTGGEVRLEVGELHLTSGGSVQASTAGSGAAGDIVIVATRGVTFSGVAGLLAVARATSAGEAGSITVTTPVLRLEDGAEIRSSTESTTVPSDAGDILIEASEDVVLSGSGIAANTLGTGNAGSVRVAAPRVRLEDGAFIDSTTIGAGDAGDIVIEASEDIVLSGVSVEGFGSEITASTSGGTGNAGSVRVTAPRVHLGDGAFVASSTFGSGTGGEVRLEVGELQLTGGSAVAAGAFGPAASGTGGDVVVEASEDIVLSGVDVEGFGSEITASTLGGTGNAGSVRVTAPRVRLEDGALVSSNTDGSGTGGEVRLEVGELHLTGGSAVAAGTFGSDASGTGGDVVVEASLLEMRDDALISAESTGSGDAGSVRVTADEVFAEDGSEISVAAASADGGDVVLAVRDRVHLVNSAISADVGDGKGGNIRIDPTFVILDHSEIVARAGEGTGGEITIVADALIQDPESLISASAGNPSLSGSVNVNAPDVDLAASLAQLSDSALDASDAITPPCSARRRGETPGSFVFSGRQGVPPGPEGALAAWPVEPGPQQGQRLSAVALQGGCDVEPGT